MARPDPGPSMADLDLARGTARTTRRGQVLQGTADQGCWAGVFCDSCGATAHGSDEELRDFARQHICGDTE
jgi:hypothetical protein